MDPLTTFYIGIVFGELLVIGGYFLGEKSKKKIKSRKRERLSKDELKK